MNETKRKKLEAAGWRVGSVDDFLGLSEIESVIVELRLALSRALRTRRTKLHLSQKALADRIKSSQSRVAKMEAADPAVSFELLLRGLLATGASRHEVASAFDDPSTYQEARSSSLVAKGPPRRTKRAPARGLGLRTGAASSRPDDRGRRARSSAVR